MTMDGDDEIGQLAHETMTLGERCLDAIERNIAQATQASRWDEVQKWCRVRFRIQRLRQEQRRNEELYIRRVRASARPGLRLV
jgi:hypothetical protein